MAQQQKILLYVFPLFFAVTGINFPVGVLIYWLTTNLWSMGQQFYVIRNNPQPGTPAYTAWEEREAAKRRRKNARRRPGGTRSIVDGTARPAPAAEEEVPQRAAEEGARRPGPADPAGTGAGRRPIRSPTRTTTRRPPDAVSRETHDPHDPRPPEHPAPDGAPSTEDEHP